MAIALMSVVLLVWTDVEDNHGGIKAGGKNRLVGDMLTLGGSFLGGVSRVGLEHSISNHGPYEFLGFVGFFGSIVSICQFLLLERVEQIRWELWEVGVLLAAFTIAQFAYYSSLPHLIRLSSAAGLHLSLLATDYYSIAAGVIFFNYHFSPVHLLSLALVLVGSVLFNIIPVPKSGKSGSVTLFLKKNFTNLKNSDGSFQLAGQCQCLVITKEDR